MTKSANFSKPEIVVARLKKGNALANIGVQ